MCYRAVKWHTHTCGHEKPGAHTEVDCGSARCRYSAAHVTPCSNCGSTCKQW
ncbi:hypothetical protein B0H10DRAFT_1725143, partial [Mycena sp. CBHHK59/15]